MSTPNNAATAKLNLVPGPLTEGTKAFPHPPPRLGRLGGLEYDNIVYSCEPGYRPLFLDLRSLNCSLRAQHAAKLLEPRWRLIEHRHHLVAFRVVSSIPPPPPDEAVRSFEAVALNPA